MAVINGSFTGIANTKVKPYIDYSLSQSVAGNYTDITIDVKFTRVNTAYYGTNTVNHSCTTNINGTTNTDSDADFDLTGATVTQTVKSQTTRVYHNTDGTKSCWIGTSGDTNISWDTYNFGATITLPAIPREAYITNSVSFEIGDNIPLTIINAGSMYVKALLYVNATLIKTVNLGQVTSATITPTSGENDAMYAQIPSAKSCAMYIRLQTFSDSEYSVAVGGNRDQTGTCSIDETVNKPTFTTWSLANVDKNVVVVDKHGSTLITSSTLALLGSNAKAIKGYSKVSGEIIVANKAVPLNSATMVNYGMTSPLPENPNDFKAPRILYDEEPFSAGSTVTLELDNPLENSFEVDAVDSRGLSTGVVKTFGTWIEYEECSLYTVLPRRDNMIDSETKIYISGRIWNYYFGGGTSGVENELTLEYRYKETTEEWGVQAWTEITPVTVNSYGEFEWEDYINGDLGASGFDSTKSYNIEVRMYDKLSHSLTEVTLSKGKPLIHATGSGIAINGKYDTGIGGDIQLSGNIFKDGIPFTPNVQGWMPLTMYGTWDFECDGSEYGSVAGQYLLNWNDSMDVLSYLEAGMKLKWTQDGATGDARIVLVQADGGLNYTEMVVRMVSTGVIQDTATYPVTNIFFSMEDTPFGFEPELRNGRLAGIRILTVGSGTYTTPYGVTKLVVECQAGGGGGGGGAGTAANYSGIGSGGSGGGYCKKFITNPDASYDYVVGGGGSGGSAGNNAGNDGADTTFGTAFMVANKGTAGGGGANANTAYTGPWNNGGGASGGDINIPGGGVIPCIRISGAISWSGSGGDSVLGNGGSARYNVSSGNGWGGSGYGGGGGGGMAGSGSANRAGGSGANGVIIIHEYY